LDRISIEGKDKHIFETELFQLIDLNSKASKEMKLKCSEWNKIREFQKRNVEWKELRMILRKFLRNYPEDELANELNKKLRKEIISEKRKKSEKEREEEKTMEPSTPKSRMYT